MLEFLRRSSTSLFAWLLLGLLALVFGLSFGLPSDSLSFGSTPLAKVHGEGIDENQFNSQLALVSAALQVPADEDIQKMYRIREQTLESLIERELLAHEAEEMGLSATKEDTIDLIRSGGIIIAGDLIDWLGGDQVYTANAFKMFLQKYGLPEPLYVKMQRDELLAMTVRDVLASSVAVSEAEVRKQYEASANRMSIRYALFEAERFGELVDPTPEEIARAVSEHRDELAIEAAVRKADFSRLGKQVRLWVIGKNKPEGTDAGKVAAPRKELASAAERIDRGADFRRVARELSELGSARSGGDHGWVSVTNGSGLDPVVDQALGELEVGKLSGILEGERALYLIRTTDPREGDVPEQDILEVLAEERLKRDKGRKLARVAAEEAGQALASGKSIDEVFKTPTASDKGGARETSVELQHSGLVGHGELGIRPGLDAAALERIAAAEAGGPLLDEIFEVPSGYTLVGLDEKKSATDEEFAGQRRALFDALAQNKARAVRSAWVKRVCLEAKAQNDLSINEEKVARVFTYDTTKDSPIPSRPYKTCELVGLLGRIGRTGPPTPGG